MNTKKWWFVFNPYEKKFPTVRQATFELAYAEAERICKLTGKKVHVLECVGTFYPPTGPVWESRSAE